MGLIHENKIFLQIRQTQSLFISYRNDLFSPPISCKNQIILFFPFRTLKFSRSSLSSKSCARCLSLSFPTLVNPKNSVPFSHCPYPMQKLLHPAINFLGFLKLCGLLLLVASVLLRCVTLLLQHFDQNHLDFGFILHLLIIFLLPL